MVSKPTRALLVAVLMGLVSGAAGSEDREPLRMQVAECQRIDAADARLECFDGIPPVATGALTEPRPPSPRADEKVDATGRPAPRVEDDPPAESAPGAAETDAFPMASTIAEVRRGRDRKLVFRLANGTVWREQEVSGLGFDEGQPVTVTASRALFIEGWKRYRLEIGPYTLDVRPVR